MFIRGFFLLIIFVASNINQSLAQNYADPNYYLVDSLDLDLFTETDSLLVDSNLKKYHNTQLHDTIRYNALTKIVEQSWNDHIWPKYNEWLYYKAQELLKDRQLSEREIYGYKFVYIAAVANIGYLAENEGNVAKALEYYRKALIAQDEMDNKEGMAITLNNIGHVYKTQGNILKALEIYNQSLEIRREIKDTSGIANSLNNIAIIYETQEEKEKALELYLESLELRQKIGDRFGEGSSLRSIGLYYYGENNLDKAEQYFNEFLEIRTELGEKQGTARGYNYLGNVYEKKGELDSALVLYQIALEIREELSLSQGICQSLYSIASLEAKLGKWEIAKEKTMRAYNMALAKGYVYEIRDLSILLSSINKNEGNYQKALEMYELHIQMRDSIKNEETQKAAIRQQTKYEFEKQQLVKEQEQLESARLIAEETSRRNNLQYSMIFLGILLFFGLVLSLGFIKVSSTVAEGLIFFAFLIFFEFLLVLADPYIESFTGGEPMWKLLANAFLAGAIFPAHTFFERVLKKRVLKVKRHAK